MINILQQPQEITPSNNPIPLVAISTYAGDDGFRYNVKIRDASNMIISEVMVYPDSNNNNYLIFDASMILSDKLNSLSYDDYYTETIREKEDGLYQFFMIITEYIGTTPGDATATDVKYTFKGVKQYGDYWDFEEYLLNGTNRKFLTNKTTRNYKLDEYGTIDMFYGSYIGGLVPKGYIRVKIYQSNGIEVFYFNNYPSSGHITGIWTIPVGPFQINNMAIGGNLETFSGTPTTGEVIHDKDNIDPTTFYTITHCDNNKIPQSEDIRVDINHKCYRHEGVEFLYLGELGTYETFSARMADINGYKTSRSEVKTNPNHIIDDQYHYNVGDRGRTVVNSRTTQSYDVITDWMTDEETRDLMELFSSSDVYIIKDNNTYPVVITNTSYDERNIQNDRLFNYTISFDMAYEKLTNR